MQLLGILLMAPQDGQDGNWVMTIMPWILILFVFYFFMIRPQQKRAKEEKKFRSSLDKNVRVVTIGGIHGVITEVAEDTVVIKTEGGQKMRIEKSAVSMNNSATLSEEKAGQSS